MNTTAEPSSIATRRRARVSRWEHWILLVVAASVAYPVLWALCSRDPLPFGNGSGIGEFANLRIGGLCLLEMLLLVVVAFLPRLKRRQFVLGYAAGMAAATGFVLVFYVGGGGNCFIVASLALAWLSLEPAANGS